MCRGISYFESASVQATVSLCDDRLSYDTYFEARDRAKKN